MKLIIAIDAFLVSQVERVSRGVQLLTGWSCFQQARALYAISATCILLTGPTFSANIENPWARVSIILTFTIAAVIYFLVLTSPDSRWMEDQIETGRFANYRKTSRLSAIARLFALLFQCANLPFSPLFMKGFNVCVALAMYLDACDPLPPCDGKIREWLKPPARLEPQGVK